MGLWNMTAIGTGLAMDAACVAMAESMIPGRPWWRRFVFIPVLFGIFQGLMPIAGYCAGHLFIDILERYSGIIVSAVLISIGLKTIYEGFDDDNHDDRCFMRGRSGPLILIIQAFLTSIDAFAVGTAIAGTGADILTVSCVIASVTVFITFIASVAGMTAGNVFGRKAEMIGGIILVATGVKGVV